MQPRTWLAALIVLAFATTLFLAVAKVRSPQLKFDRIELGMSSDEVEQMMGKPPTVQLLYSTRSNGGFVNHAYPVGIYDIDVYLSRGKVTDKSIAFRPPWRPAERYGQRFVD